jgi:histidine triad (HIT) family protein
VKVEDCIFCKIGYGEIPAEFVYQDDSAFVIRDIKPQAKIHLLAIPFNHIEGLADHPQSLVEPLGHLISVAVSVAKEQGVDLTGYRLIINQGNDASQEIPHLHVHLLAGQSLAKLG